LIRVRLDSYRPLRDVVFDCLREAIISGTLRPGERLMEIQLAEEMGVSRTPVREAIRKLELEGLVVIAARRGAYVSDISIKDISNVFEIRAALEGLAASLAAERISEKELDEMERVLALASGEEAGDVEELIRRDNQFHTLIYQASRNERLVNILSNLQEQVDRFRAISLATPGRGREAMAEHQKIAEAIAGRNAEEALSLGQQHVENAETALLATLPGTDSASD